MYLSCLFRHFIVFNSINDKKDSNQKKGCGQIEHFVEAAICFPFNLKQLASADVRSLVLATSYFH